jgi:opacity protein-like surface antigen
LNFIRSHNFMIFKRTLAAGAFLIATAIAANAADLPHAPMAPAPPPPPPMAAPAFDWSGPYVGAYAGMMIGNGFMFGADAGYAFQFGRFVASVEAAVGTTTAGPPLHLNAWARLGPTLGERAWIYALAGWSNWGPLEFGGGMAFALRDNLTFHTDVTVYCCTSPIMIKAGLDWHFGR